MWRSLALLVSLVFAAVPAMAQLPAEIRGRVVEHGTGARIVGARVEAPGAAAATTGPDGGFVLRGVVPGVVEVDVSAPGYRASSLPLRTENGRSAWLEVELEAEPIALAALVAVARRTSAGATTISRETIEASGARELGDVLRTQPGVVVTRMGGPGSPAHISIRGASADETLVLLDGVPINSPLTGEADLSSVPLERVERVVVLRGAQSARYGAGALAGVVLVETRRPRTAELSMRSGVGSWGERSAAASVGGRAPGSHVALSGLASAEWRSVRGDFDFRVPAERGGGTGTRINADAHTVTAGASGTLDSGGRELRARLDVLDLERGMPGTIGQQAAEARQEQRRTSAGLGATTGAFGAVWRGDVDVQSHRARLADPNPPYRQPYDERTHARSVAADLSADGHVGPWQLGAGVSTRDLRFRSSTLIEGAPRNQQLHGVWAQARGVATTGGGWRGEVVPALRADWHSAGDGAVLSPRISAALARGPWSARTAVGSAFSPPSLADQFFQAGLRIRPNPELRAERVRHEIEGAVALHEMAVGGARIDAELSLFRADVDGMVLWLPDHQFVWSPSNFDIRRRGWETDARVAFPWKEAEVRARAGHVAVEYTGDVHRGQVVYRPRWTAGGSAAARLAGTRVEATAEYVGRRRIVPGEELVTLAPYWLAGVRLARPFRLNSWNGDVALGVDNVLARNAAMLIDFPYPGRAWTLGVRLRHTPRRSAVAGDFHPR